MQKSYSLKTKLLIRSFFIGTISSCISLLLVLRLAHILRREQIRSKSIPDIFRYSIRDTRGSLLAFNERTESVYADLRRVPDCMKGYIKTEFGIKNFPVSSFIWIKRDADQSTIEKVKAINIPGLCVKKDWKRVYPWSSILWNLIGFCDKDMQGKYGAEYALNDTLFKEEVQLTIDLVIQKILAEILMDGISQFEIEGASGLVVDAQSGDILAMVSLPCPQKPADFLKHKFRNRNLDPKEVGSILKLHNVALALEEGGYTLDSIVDGRGPLKIGRFEINDFFGVDNYMTLRESIWRSSNIANARVALQIGAERQKQFFQKLGLLENLEWLDRCVVCPKKPSPWGKTANVTLSYGYGIGLSSLHLARSILRLIHGYDFDLRLLKNSPIKLPKRIISAKTSEHIREVMRDVIKFSNNKRWKNIRYEVGAKTGTANICVRGKYLEGRNFVTMVCVFPAHMPKILLLIQMKDPPKNKLTSGRFTTAANVLGDYMAVGVKRIGAARMLKKTDEI